MTDFLSYPRLTCAEFISLWTYEAYETNQNHNLQET